MFGTFLLLESSLSVSIALLMSFIDDEGLIETVVRRAQPLRIRRVNTCQQTGTFPQFGKSTLTSKKWRLYSPWAREVSWWRVLSPRSCPLFRYVFEYIFLSMLYITLCQAPRIKRAHLRKASSSLARILIKSWQSSVFMASWRVSCQWKCKWNHPSTPFFSLLTCELDHRKDYWACLDSHVVRSFSVLRGDPRV